MSYNVTDFLINKGNKKIYEITVNDSNCENITLKYFCEYDGSFINSFENLSDIVISFTDIKNFFEEIGEENFRKKRKFLKKFKEYYLTKM